MKDCYIEYDGIGMKAIYCMSCLKEILGERDIVEQGGKTAMVFKRNSSYTQKLINILNDGKPSSMNYICCKECVKQTPDITHIINQVRLGVRASLQATGQAEEDIAMFLNKEYNLTEEKKEV
ncbi:MAG: hypothetical protein Q8P28_03270 [Deltaproteobacteria bacterium]|nr:hypothetical protein [Deltaproteobacteria bacterium]